MSRVLSLTLRINTLKLAQNRHGAGLEMSMNWRILLALLCATLYCQEVKAEHGGVSAGVLGQAKTNTHSVVPSVGAFSMFQLGGGESSEIHASAWINVVGLGGGAGGGTIHHLKSFMFVGWEMSAEYEAEENEELWFLGAGPLFEAAAGDRLHFFVKLPVGWEHSHHHDRLGWSAIGGVSLAIVH